MIAKMNKWSGWVTETSPDILNGKYKKLLLDCGFTIRKEVFEFFEPQGFTALYLLSESHFAIHTFPEEGKTYLELSSCIDKPFELFIKATANDETLKAD